jgi:hypothetical protein
MLMAAVSTLAQIQTMIRKLTRSVSESQITTPQINEYIDTFVLHDLPANIAHNFLKTTFTFYTKPGVDTYGNSTVVGDDFFDFKNIYTSIRQPVFVNGNRAFFSQSRDEFYGLYPLLTPPTNEVLSNGTNTYAGKLSIYNSTGSTTNYAILRNTVYFAAQNLLGEPFKVYDTGVTDPITGLGELTGNGTGTIDYDTGDYTIVFNQIPAATTYVVSSCYTYTAAQPTMILFYDTQLILRPVPDKVYKIQIGAIMRPSSMGADGTTHPDLDDWSEYIALGAAMKIYRDRFDFESANALKEDFRKQEIVCMRRVIRQQTDLRSTTNIMSNQYSNGFNEIWR